MKARFCIPFEAVSRVLEWFARGEVRLWKNAEIGVMRPEIIIPAECPKPHWAYTDDGKIAIEEIDVLKTEPISGPMTHVRIRRSSYGSVELASKTNLKLLGKAKQLGDDVAFDWEYVGDGKARVEFYRQEFYSLQSFRDGNPTPKQISEDGAAESSRGPSHHGTRLPTGVDHGTAEEA